MSTRKTILIVEDEEDILNLVEFHLSENGFDTITCSSGDEVFKMVEADSPDLILLDIMLPGMNGTEICKVLKQDQRTKNMPVIMLTAKGEEIDRVVGFELGADDYVTKPFSPRELILRIKAILKRTQPVQEPEQSVHLGEIEINVPKHQVQVSGRIIELTATEFKLLLTLVERRGRVQSRDMLLESVWGYDYAGFTRTVDTHMRRLRAKLGEMGDCIETVRGVGYRIKEM